MRKGKRRSFEQRNYVFLKPSRGHLQVVALALHSQQPALRVQLPQAEPVFGVNAALIERHNGLVLAQLVELEVGALAGLNLHRKSVGNVEKNGWRGGLWLLLGRMRCGRELVGGETGTKLSRVNMTRTRDLSDRMRCLYALGERARAVSAGG